MRGARNGRLAAGITPTLWKFTPSSDAAFRSAVTVACTGAKVEGAVVRRDALAGCQHAVDGAERVVRHPAQGVRASVGRRRDPASRRLDVPVRDLLEGAAERLQDPIELDAHLVRQRPAGVVVRRSWWRAGIRDDVGMILRLEHVNHVRPKRLRGQHDERSRCVALVRNLEVARGPMDGHVHFAERVHEFDRGGEVWLARGNDVATRVAPFRTSQLRPGFRVGVGCATTAASAASCLGEPVLLRNGRVASRRRRPGVLAATLDRTLSHLPDVEQQGLAVPRGVVDDRTVERDRVIHRLPEAPLLRCDRIGQVAVGQLPRQDERDTHRRRAADGLREDGDDVVEVAGVPDPTVPPPVIRPT